MSCKICDKPTETSCSNCKQAFYCCTEHQKQDWKSHKADCFPFKVATNEDLGRHCIAARNIKASELVLKENPILCGPSVMTGPVCLGCLNTIDEKDHLTCDKCNWPMCSEECKNVPEHKAECELTVKRGRKVNIQDFIAPHPLYRCMSTVRSLLLEKTDKGKWEKFQQLESLENERRGSLQWKTDLETIGRFIPKFFDTDEFDEDKIMRTIGILQINGHEVPTTDPTHVSVFHRSSYFEHSCTPNLAKSFTKDCQILLWAPNPIKKNEHLSICYTDVVWPTADRQSHLMHTKLFKCNCRRCMDVTELGTYYSAIKCENKSCQGLLLPASLKDWNEMWSCNVCSAKVEKVYVDKILEKAQKDLNAMEKTLENSIKYINHYQKWLHDRHYHICDVKIQLIQQIGKDPKELMIVPDDQLKMKMTYCRELIELFEILAPCEIRLLGTLCFEMHATIAENSRRISLETSLSPKSLLEESLMFVEKAINYLQYESNLFIEGHILKQAKANRNALNMVLNM